MADIGPAPDWQHISWMVGNYNGEPILVTVDGLGRIAWGLGAYYDRYSQEGYGVSTGVDFAALLSIVPAGEVWVVTNIAVYHDDPTPRKIQVFFRYSTTNILLFGNSFLLTDEVMDRQGFWVLEAGDYIRILYVGLANGQKGYYSVAGYKVEVPT